MKHLFVCLFVMRISLRYLVLISTRATEESFTSKTVLSGVTSRLLKKWIMVLLGIYAV